MGENIAHIPLFAAMGGAIVGAALTASFTYYIFVTRTTERERRQRAVELLNQFVAGEFYIKARLIAQEYLIPTGAKYLRSLDDGKRELNFVKLSDKLANSSEAEDHEARFFIRAIPSFFWLVDQARNKGYIDQKETVFDYHYAWYFVHIIERRIKGCQDNRMFRRMEWLQDDDVEAARKEYDRMIDALPPTAQRPD